MKAFHRVFGDSLKIRRLADPVPMTLDLLNPKSIGFDTSVKDYYCAKFQVIPIRGFRFIMPTWYTPTHVPHTP